STGAGSTASTAALNMSRRSGLDIALHIFKGRPFNQTDLNDAPPKPRRRAGRIGGALSWSQAVQIVTSLPGEVLGSESRGDYSETAPRIDLLGAIGAARHEWGRLTAHSTGAVQL